MTGAWARGGSWRAPRPPLPAARLGVRARATAALALTPHPPTARQPTRRSIEDIDEKATNLADGAKKFSSASTSLRNSERCKLIRCVRGLARAGCCPPALFLTLPFIFYCPPAPPPPYPPTPCSCYAMIAAVVITVLAIIIAYFVNANKESKRMLLL